MPVVVLVSADFEWRAVLPLFPEARLQPAPIGEWFEAVLDVQGRAEAVRFFHGGWGKISAAATTQYAIQRWSPSLLVNLGTCGGFRGEIERGEIVLVERTRVYDILEQMTDAQAALDHYATDLDLSWLSGPPPHPVRRHLLVSGDRDLIAGEVAGLKARFGAVAGDWESGAIAWVARRNGVRCLILRGVTDLVGPAGGDAYQGNLHVFADGAASVMQLLVKHLPHWLALVR
jgi:adenosylhomocysteine nucleosidase